MSYQVFIVNDSTYALDDDGNTYQLEWSEHGTPNKWKLLLWIDPPAKPLKARKKS